MVQENEGGSETERETQEAEKETKRKKKDNLLQRETISLYELVGLKKLSNDNLWPDCLSA